MVKRGRAQLQWPGDERENESPRPPRIGPPPPAPRATPPARGSSAPRAIASPARAPTPAHRRGTRTSPTSPGSPPPRSTSTSSRRRPSTRPRFGTPGRSFRPRSSSARIADEPSGGRAAFRALLSRLRPPARARPLSRRVPLSSLPVEMKREPSVAEAMPSSPSPVLDVAVRMVRARRPKRARDRPRRRSPRRRRLPRLHDGPLALRRDDRGVRLRRDDGTPSSRSSMGASSATERENRRAK